MAKRSAQTRSTADDAQAAMDTESSPEPKDFHHPLLIRLLDWALGDAFDVQGEVSLMLLSPRLDGIIIKRRSGKLPAWARELLPALTRLLKRVNMLEFKGPTDRLKIGNWEKFLGFAHVYRSQQSPPIPPEDCCLVVIARSLNPSFRRDVERLGMTLTPVSEGVHSIEGCVFSAYIIATDAAGVEHEPMLSLFSRLFRRNRQRIIERLTEMGYSTLLAFVLQQLARFQKEEWIDQMTRESVQEMERMMDEALTEIIQRTPVEKIVNRIPAKDRLQGLSPEERVQGLSPEERVQGLSPEERVLGLSEEEKQKLRDILAQGATAKKAGPGKRKAKKKSN